MPLVIDEDYLSRKFEYGRTGQVGRELIWTITGGDPSDDDEDADVEALVRATTPAVYRFRVLHDVLVEPLGGGTWRAYARYVTFENGQYTFSTGGGSARITQSKATVAYALPGTTAPDFHGAIGVSDDRVEGADIPTRQYAFSETHYFDDLQMSSGYKATLFALTGRYNNATFKGFAAGECLLQGVTGGKRDSDLWELTFNFACTPNVEDATIGDIDNIDKLGWDYLWVRYATYEDSTAFCLVQRPISVYVERVLEPGDFSLLLIGT
jgi:hypothetical protein